MSKKQRKTKSQMSREKREVPFQKCTACQEKCKGKEIRGGEEVKRRRELQKSSLIKISEAFANLLMLESAVSFLFELL